MKQIFLFFLLTAFSCRNESYAQKSAFEAAIKSGVDPYFFETNDTVAPYGPRSIVRNLIQDKNGDFWFATWQGIMRYDGKTFTNYTLKEGLIHFHIFSIYEDSKGNLWFGTVRGGLYCYDGRTFRLFTKADGLIDNTVLCMMEDEAGNIWFGTDAGVSRYDGNIFTNFTKQDGIGSVHSIIKDKAGKLLFGGEGIAVFDGKIFTGLKNKIGLPLEEVALLFHDKAGNIWIGSKNGLYRYDGTSKCEFIIPNFVMYMSESKNGNLLLSYNDYPNNGNSGLYSYDRKTFHKILEQSDDNAHIFGIIEDTSGNIWFGTLKGACRLAVQNADNPCLRKTCQHNLPMAKAIEEHNHSLAASVTYFR